MIRLEFDRGTILLRGLERERAAASGVTEVPELRWDPRVAAFRAPACRHAQLVAALAALRVPCIDAVPRASPRVASRLPALRAYQADALAAWRVAGHRGVVVLPTGAGKTHVGLAAMAALGVPTLILVPTRVLLAQWQARLREVYDGPIGVLGDGERRVEPVTVATFESAFRQLDSFGDRFGLLIVDEVHHFGSGVRAEALEMSTAPARLGLTATLPNQGLPFSSGRDATMAQLQRLVGPVVCHYSIAQLSGGYLAPFDCLRLAVCLGAEERDAYRHAHALFQEAYARFRRGGQGVTWSEFVRAASASSEGRRALAAFHEARRVVAMAKGKLELAEELLGHHRDERVLIFTAENTAAYALSRRLLIPAITCDIGRAEREAILARLREGTLRAVVSARVLNEGVDLPEARIGIILGGHLGTREHVQRVGRLLRAAPGKRAVVYDVVVSGTFEVEHARRRQRSLAA